MKFVMLVEGDTEKHAIATFLKRWLDPRLARPVGIQTVNCRGNARLIRVAQDFLESPEAKKEGIIAVVGLLDLYGLDYPPNMTTAKDRYDWAVHHFERQVGQSRFRMFFAVHEFEAWILGQPEKLPPALRDRLPKSAIHPEKVNFGQPPAKVLSELYRSGLRRRYKKPVDGKLLFEKLDPEIVAGKCPYLKSMLSQMLSLAQAAGLQIS
jgi:hypothetical protein